MENDEETTGRDSKQCVVVTSISPPNNVLSSLAAGAAENGASFVVVGDVSSPGDFELAGCDFYSLARQQSLPFDYARKCPQRHYARKNIGYLAAIEGGADIIRDTDDDNLPLSGFWKPLPRQNNVRVCDETGWANVYQWFSTTKIWPRGLPLSEVNRVLAGFESLPLRVVDCPIQQGLATGDPDVDAIYRLTQPQSDQEFADRRVALGSGVWCPFNSQNTTWHRDAFALLYLPAHCSFRMTDIWRSFVAQRVAWENGWNVVFHEATVRQERNWHDLMRDFRDEIPGYLHNEAIMRTLLCLKLEPGVSKIPGNMLACYRSLLDLGVIDPGEMPLLESWLSHFPR